MQNSISLSLDREKTVKRSKHAVVVWLAAALAPSLPRPSAKRTQNDLKKRTNVTSRGRTCRKDGPAIWNDRVSDARAAFPIISEDRERLFEATWLYLYCFQHLSPTTVVELNRRHCAPFDRASALDFIKQAFCCIWTHGEREQLVWLFICFWGVVWVQLEVDTNTIKLYCIYFMCLSVSSATRSKQHDRNIDSFICTFLTTTFSHRQPIGWRLTMVYLNVWHVIYYLLKVFFQCIEENEVLSVFISCLSSFYTTKMEIKPGDTQFLLLLSVLEKAC